MSMRLQKGQSSVTRETSDVSFINARGTRDGALYTADWIQGLIHEGRGYHVTVGAFSTGITGGGNGTTITNTEPELFMGIPDGTAVLPIRIHVQCEPPLLASDNDEIEILIAVDRLVTYADTSKGSVEVKFNMRTDNPDTSLCTVASACTSAITAPTLGIELARKLYVADVQATAGNAFWQDLDLLYEPKHPPVLMGEATLLVYFGGTVAVEGHILCEWVELPGNAFS